MSTVPRYVVIDGDPVHKAEPIKHMGLRGLVVDREEGVAYGFGEQFATLAAEKFNSGELTPAEVWPRPPLELVGEEHAQLAAAEEAFA